jgi:hypothetical protein
MTDDLRERPRSPATVLIIAVLGGVSLAFGSYGIAALMFGLLTGMQVNLW